MAKPTEEFSLREVYLLRIVETMDDPLAGEIQDKACDYGMAYDMKVRTYRVLDRLETEGFVQPVVKAIEDRKSGSRSRLGYRLTMKGVDFLDDLRDFLTGE